MATAVVVLVAVDTFGAKNVEVDTDSVVVVLVQQFDCDLVVVDVRLQ